MPDQRITVICGHYGCGKTNLALNLALEAADAGGRVTLADLDVVNPYFRSYEYQKLLEDKGVRVIAPVFAGTTLDTPTLSPALFSLFEAEAGRVFIDAGGDDVGATALGGLRAQLEQAGYQMIYVVNRYRILTHTALEAAALLREIESACRLRATGIVNNSHLGVETTCQSLQEALPFAQETAAITNLPLLYSTAPDFVSPLPPGFRPIKRYVRFAWEPPQSSLP